MEFAKEGHKVEKCTAELAAECRICTETHRTGGIGCPRFQREQEVIDTMDK